MKGVGCDLSPSGTATNNLLFALDNTVKSRIIILTKIKLQ